MSSWVDQERDVLEVSRERALERLGTRDARCGSCGVDEPIVLIQTADGVACYECLAGAGGRAQMERHHIAGQHNSSVTVEIPANQHRVLSELQRTWPEATLRNPDGSPLRQIAAALRGGLDLVHLALDFLDQIPAQIEALDVSLTRQRGPGWWVEGKPTSNDD